MNARAGEALAWGIPLVVLLVLYVTHTEEMLVIYAAFGRFIELAAPLFIPILLGIGVLSACLRD